VTTKLAAGAVALLAGLLSLIVLAAMMLGGGTASIVGGTQAACGQTGTSGGGGTSVVVDVAGVPTAVTAAGVTYNREQLVNAAHIIRAGADLGVSAHGQTIGVMTAIGESTLRVLAYGDLVGPDSRGLFQQRANGAWGSYADRMDPYISATNFFRALVEVSGWETLAPTIAAHRTQRNADPYHYERFWDDAVAIVEALAGVDLGGLAPGTGGQACLAAPPGQVAADGWILPTTGTLTSGFGMRWGSLHRGIDLAAPIGTPIYAAGPGTATCEDGSGNNCAVVISAGPATGFGLWVRLDHGGGVTTVYGHNNTNTVTVGQTVKAGQQIAEVGNRGQSTGPHVHFEVHVDGTAVDPQTFAPLQSAFALAA
jgi:murein DD-endopeptidase MepM/ murein hydrolase activator NlpD